MVIGDIETEAAKDAPLCIAFDLEFLGVTAIWLLPFYPSPLRDDGYDIADYYSINPNYGNINQFKKLIKEDRYDEHKLIGSHFAIRNPQAVSGCGCGASFSLG